MAATDIFASYILKDAPAENYGAITPNDGTDLTQVCRAIWVGTGGDVALVSPSGGTATFKNVADGTLLPCRASRVKVTGTTATDIVGLY